jgi:hypothetical protein
MGALLDGSMHALPEATRSVLNAFLENVIRDAFAYTEHARRNTARCAPSTASIIYSSRDASCRNWIGIA